MPAKPLTTEEEIQLLRDRVAILEDALGISYNAPPEWRLTPTEERLLGILLKCQIAPYERIFAALWGDVLEPPSEHLLAVHACRLKRKLRQQGYVMKSLHRFGYFIPTADKAKLAAFH